MAVDLHFKASVDPNNPESHFKNIGSKVKKEVSFIEEEPATKSSFWLDILQTLKLLTSKKMFWMLP